MSRLWLACLVLVVVGLPVSSADRYGTALAIAGDVNGDGFDDVLVGAWGWHDGSGKVGAAFLYRGSPNGPSTTADWSAFGADVGSRFGEQVCSAGDVDNDGFDDILVGASLAGGGAGRVELYRGSAGGLSTVPDWAIEGAAGQLLGGSLTCGFDVDADDFDDIAIRAITATATELRIFRGSAAGLSMTPDWIIYRTQDSVPPQLGGAGDFGGDGFGDLIIHSNYAFQIVRGSATGPIGNGGNAAILPGYEYPPDAVASAGDVTGDGIDDVVSGAGGEDSASAYYSPNPIPFEFTGSGNWEVSGEPGFGTAVSTAGDIDGDGIDEVAIGVPSWNGVRGRVSVFRGSTVGLLSVPTWHVDAMEPWTEFGTHLAGGGDVNGDGFDDLLVGSNAGQLLFPNLERAWVFAGSAGGLVGNPLWTQYGRVPPPDGRLVSQIQVRKASGGTRLIVNWQYEECPGGAVDYQLYEGVLGDFGSHAAVQCGLGGSDAINFEPMLDDSYFLIVPHNGASEGSYGLDSEGFERPQAMESCRPQRIAACN